MNNFHIYEEVGRGKDSVVYKVSCTFQYMLDFITSVFSDDFV